MERIPVAFPLGQVMERGRAIRAAIDRVLASGRFILGAEVEAFETEFAAYLGSRYCVTTGNGTDALALALQAVGVASGDEVITVSHTSVATVAAIEQIGAVPVFADVDPATRCLDPGAIETLLTDRTRAVLPVHLYGQPAALDALRDLARRFDLKLVEDCAQAHGAAFQGRKVGTFGEAAAFSFYPTKNLAALGDGGTVVTDSAQVATAVRRGRQYGWARPQWSLQAGMNSRLDEIQAAVLRVNLPYLQQDNVRRRRIAEHYRQALDGTAITAPASAPGTLHAMHLFVIECPERDALAAHLDRAGIDTALHYPAPVHRQPAYAGRIRGRENLPATEALSQRILTLPLYPHMEEGWVLRVCDALQSWGARHPS